MSDINKSIENYYNKEMENLSREMDVTGGGSFLDVELTEYELAKLHKDILEKIDTNKESTHPIYPEILMGGIDFTSEVEVIDDEASEDDEKYLTPEEMMLLSMGSRLREPEEFEELPEDKIEKLHRAMIKEMEIEGYKSPLYYEPEAIFEEEEIEKEKVKPVDEVKFLSPDEMLLLSMGEKLKHPEELEELPREKLERLRNAMISEMEDKGYKAPVLLSPSFIKDESEEFIREKGEDYENLDKISAISPYELFEGEVETEDFNQLDLKPILKKKDIDSPLEIASPDEIEISEEFISRALKINTIVGERYKIKKLIYEKKFQAVYIVKDIGLTGKTYILNEIFVPESIKKDGIKARKDKFRDIVRLFIASKHSNMSNVFELFQENQREYCVMERVEGIDLEKLSLMANKPLSESELIRFGSQLCDAVEFLHYRPTPFTLGTLEPHHIFICDGNIAKIIEYDFQRFFDPNRTLDFLPNDPTKLYSDITKLARIFYFLISKKKYNHLSSEIIWPDYISKKMRKLLQVACAQGQKTYGDIRIFKEKFLETQVEEKDEKEYIKKKYNFPIHKIQFNFFKNFVNSFNKLSLIVRLLVFVFIGFLIFYHYGSKSIRTPSFVHPKIPVVYVFTKDSVGIYDTINYSLLFSKHLGGDVLVVNEGVAYIQKDTKSFNVEGLFLGYKGISSIGVLNINNLKFVTSINTENSSPSRVISDDKGERFFFLYPKVGSVEVLDLKQMRIVDNFITDIEPVDLVYLPKGKIKKNISTPTLIVSSSGNNNLLFLDASSGKIKGNLKIDGKPGKMVLSDGNSKLLVADTKNKRILSFDLMKDRITKKYSLRGLTPHDMIMDEKGVIWITLTKKNRNLIGLLNLKTGKLETIQSSGKQPSKIILDSHNKKVWVINERTKNIAIFDMNRKQLVTSIMIDKKPISMYVDKAVNLK